MDKNKIKVTDQMRDALMAEILGDVLKTRQELESMPEKLNFVSVKIQERHEAELRKKAGEVLKYYVEQTKKHIEHQLTGAIKGQIDDLKTASAAGWQNVRALLYIVLASTLTLNGLMGYALFFSK